MRSAPASGMLIGMRVRLLLVGVLVAASTAGCSFADRICGGDEYPVKAVGNTTGAACVPEGEEPPDGYVKYPEGKVPERVGDKWDEYWSKVVVDENGAIVSE
jgi:hypothetical protein